MMLDEYQGISESEFEQLKDAVAAITILIASADGTINEHETD